MESRVRIYLDPYVLYLDIMRHTGVVINEAEFRVKFDGRTLFTYNRHTYQIPIAFRTSIGNWMPMILLYKYTNRFPLFDNLADESTVIDIKGSKDEFCGGTVMATNGDDIREEIVKVLSGDVNLGDPIDATPYMRVMPDIMFLDAWSLISYEMKIIITKRNPMLFVSDPSFVDYHIIQWLPQTIFRYTTRLDAENSKTVFVLGTSFWVDQHYVSADTSDHIVILDDGKAVDLLAF